MKKQAIVYGVKVLGIAGYVVTTKDKVAAQRYAKHRVGATVEVIPKRK